MKRKVIITTLENKVVTSIMEEDEIVELNVREKEDQNKFRLGNIYIGKVKKVVSNIQAAFIEISPGIECYYAMSEKGNRMLKTGEELVVQICKEAIKTKQPSVTSKISLTGKYVVLTSGDTRIGVSSKIEKEKRDELQKEIEPFRTEQYGLIIRTNAKDCPLEKIKKEIRRLSSEYETIMKKASTRVCFSCLKEAVKPYIADLRNIYEEGLTDIIVEDQDIYLQMKKFLEEEQPEDADKLKRYEDKLLPLHKLYSIEKALKDAMQKTVWMKSGAYLVIEPTEALTVIDVNTGKCIGKKKDDPAYFKINVEAAKEAAKQIRLRNLSGIILIDFINLDDPDKKEQLLSVLKGCLKKDPIQTMFIDVTKLQLVELTRKKVRRPLHESLRS